MSAQYTKPLEIDTDRSAIGSRGESLSSLLTTERFLSICDRDDPVDSLTQSVLIHGHAHRALDLLPEQGIQTVVTSPPYWSLRDYEIDDQIGRDECLEEYIAGIVGTFDKIRRVLKDDGTVWLNVGDVYTSGNRRYRAPDK